MNNTYRKHCQTLTAEIIRSRNKLKLLGYTFVSEVNRSLTKI